MSLPFRNSYLWLLFSLLKAINIKNNEYTPQKNIAITNAPSGSNSSLSIAYKTNIQTRKIGKFNNHKIIFCGRVRLFQK